MLAGNSVHLFPFPVPSQCCWHCAAMTLSDSFVLVGNLYLAHGLSYSSLCCQLETTLDESKQSQELKNMCFCSPSLSSSAKSNSYLQKNCLCTYVPFCHFAPYNFTRLIPIKKEKKKNQVQQHLLFLVQIDVDLGTHKQCLRRSPTIPLSNQKTLLPYDMK